MPTTSRRCFFGRVHASANGPNWTSCRDAAHVALSRQNTHHDHAAPDSGTGTDIAAMAAYCRVRRAS